MLRRLLPLLAVSALSLHAAALSVAVDTGAPAHPVSPMIYGVSAKSPEDIPAKARYSWYRLGGNRITAYNWETNDSNAGKDYFHQSDDWAGKGKPGAFVQRFLKASEKRGTPSCLTVQMGDWLAGDRAGPVTPGTPLPQRFVQNHLHKPGKASPTPDLRDRHVYQDEFLAWVASINPGDASSPAKTLLVCLDNEPDLWNSTHALIFPAKVTYADLLRRSTEAAALVRSRFPKAVIMGPASFGWHGYGTLNDAPDRAGRHWLDTYLETLAQASSAAGTRLLDALSVHFYSEAHGGGTRVVFEEDKPAHLSEACIQARLHAPRSLWDPRYVETSWITKSNGGKPLLLIPSLQERISRLYPGTALAINEYNFGGGDHISGALALLDALGIYARCEVEYACLWPEGPTAWHHAAMTFLRNFDGKGSAVGEAMLPVQASDTANFSTYAYRSDKGGFQLLILNKRGSAQVLDLKLTGKAYGSCRRYVLDAKTSPKAPAHRSEKQDAPAAGKLSLTLPPLSATLLAFDK